MVTSKNRQHGRISRPIVPAKTEGMALRKLAHMLGEFNENHTGTMAPVVTTGDDQLVLPDSVVRALTELVRYLEADEGVMVLPLHQELTTQEAADLLNVSRPYLINLIDDKKIPYRMTGTHRRLRLADVLSYRQQRDEDRDAGLTELARISQELGEYD